MRKTILITNMLFALILLSFTAAIAAAPVGITGPELQKMMKDGKPVKIVDVREPELFSRGHIPGAINIPYDDAFKSMFRELSPKERIVFVCHGGPMGDELGTILLQKGYKEVYNVKGGMRRWDGPLAVK